jgi:RNA polymerase sigma-70 factor (ECF subfamily)
MNLDFEQLFRRHERELRVHCYRMTGSLLEAEELVQDTFLRAWRGRAEFEERSSGRNWLYAIATNACLDARRRKPPRVLPDRAGAGGEIAWLEPFPDERWEPAAPLDQEPASRVERAETIELVFIAAIQLLPPRQRAALILRDCLGASVRRTAEILGAGEAATNSALQRARETLRAELPAGREEWGPPRPPTAAERDLLDRYVAAVEGADLAAIEALLATDVETTMPPLREWFAGREAVLAALRHSWDPTSDAYVGQLSLRPLAINGGPGVAAYSRPPGATELTAFALAAIVFEADRIASLTAFHEPSLFPRFGLPMSFSPTHVSI